MYASVAAGMTTTIGRRAEQPDSPAPARLRRRPPPPARAACRRCARQAANPTRSPRGPTSCSWPTHRARPTDRPAVEHPAKHRPGAAAVGDHDQSTCPAADIRQRLLHGGHDPGSRSRCAAHHRPRRCPRRASRPGRRHRRGRGSRRRAAPPMTAVGLAQRGVVRRRETGQGQQRRGRLPGPAQVGAHDDVGRQRGQQPSGPLGLTNAELIQRDVRMRPGTGARCSTGSARAATRRWCGHARRRRRRQPRRLPAWTGAGSPRPAAERPGSPSTAAPGSRRPAPRGAARARRCRRSRAGPSGPRARPRGVPAWRRAPSAAAPRSRRRSRRPGGRWGRSASRKASVMTSCVTDVVGDDVVRELVGGCLGRADGQGDGLGGGGHRRANSCRGLSVGTVARYSRRFAMYCTTPSGTRYHTGSPRPARSRHSVEEMASAGTSTRRDRVAPAGQGRRGCARPGAPRRSAPARTARRRRRQVRIWASASAPVMKNSSTSGRVGAQVAQGVDRCTWPAAVDVDPAHREVRVRGSGDDRHQIAVLGRGHRPRRLLPRLPGGHEDDLVEAEPARPRWRRPGGRGGSGRTSHPSRPARIRELSGRDRSGS